MSSAADPGQLARKTELESSPADWLNSEGHASATWDHPFTAAESAVLNQNQIAICFSCYAERVYFYMVTIDTMRQSNRASLRAICMIDLSIEAL